MADPASVSDLLAVLELGSASGDTALADQLRGRFGIAPDVDLASALGAVPPGEVLAALTSAVAPVAAMVRDLYMWLGQLAGTRSTANLSVRVTDAQMRAMDLNPARYEAYESTIVENVSKIEFDPSRLPPDSALLRFHDAHWQPACLDDTVTRTPRCRNCHPGMAEEFRELETLLHSAVTAMPPTQDLQEVFHDERRFFFTNLPRWLSSVTTRRSSRRECPYGELFITDYLRLGLPDLAGCFRELSAQQLTSFFELPYWKARWQVFELWVLRLVLGSYGTNQWLPRLTDGVWNLKAGSTNPAAIATSQLIDGRELRCYYQHEAVPPASLFAGLRDRPELLVTIAADHAGPVAPGSDTEPVLLAVEAKARSGYGPQNLKSAIFPLLEWRPRRILGASYFSSTGADRLHIQQFGDTTIGVAEALVPASASTSSTIAWLDETWQELPRPRVTIIAADVSASMPASAAKKRLRVMAERAANVPRPHWADSLAEADLLFLSTFGGPVPGLNLLPEFSAEEIARARLRLTPRARGQNFGQAVREWQAGLAHVPISRIRLNVHLVTDGRWTDRDLAALDEYRLAGAEVYLHVVDEPEHPLFRDELRHLVVE